MATDIAELLKARVLAILETVPAQLGGQTPTYHRNRVDLPPEQCPALVLLDGREERLTTTRGRGSMPHAMMAWHPQVWIALRERATVENEGVGEELSAFRIALLAALKEDAQLLVLMGENGEIEYRGYETDMAIGSDLIGNMVLNFSISYFWDPEDMV